MSEQRKPLMAVDLGENGGVFTFGTLEEIDLWLDKEQRFWAWIGSVPRDESVLQQVWERMEEARGRIRRAFDHARNQENQPVFESAIEALRTQINNSFSEGQLLHSTTPRAQLIEAERASDPKRAIYALAHFLGVGTMHNARPYAQGTFDALCFDKGVVGVADAERRALKLLQKETQEILDDLRTKVRTNSEESGRINKDLRERLAEHEASHGTLMEEHKAAHVGELERARVELENISRTYEERTALQAPVMYWRGKRRKHKILAIVFGIATALAMLGGGLLAYWEILWLLEGLEPDQYPAPWKIGGLLISATLILWVIRILVRIFFSNLHLEADASERMTMVQTYLALIRKGKGPKDEDRQLILQTLFRPASTGIVKDDAVPPSILEWLTRVGSGKGG
jgi:hypothetical protein